MATSSASASSPSSKNTGTVNGHVNVKDYDVLIIGAGISGISAAYHLQENCPGKTYRIVERRQNLGGTWDLFNYPGIRSDSDMYTFGFSFRPWQNADSKIIASKDMILQYLKETVEEYGIEKRIDYGIQIQQADWDSQDAKWTMSGIVENATNSQQQQQRVTYRAQYIFLCVGYYNYDQGYIPSFPGAETFQGPIVHPQHWPKDLDYANKKVVVIGSGATAITLIPAMTRGPKAAKHVTMLQRSPTYMFARPSRMTIVSQKIAAWFGHSVARWYFVMFSMFQYSFCKFFPKAAKQGMIDLAEHQVGEKVFRKEDFTPRYDPWDERLCLCPDGDFFESLKSGKASIVTDHIVKFTRTGIQLQNTQEELPADVIISATGLQLQFGGGIQCRVDGEILDISSRFVYKGFMLNNLPNTFVAGGYTNASWTLKVDLTNKCACRLISHMDRHGQRYCQPEVSAEDNMKALQLLDLTSGYVQRSAKIFPKQSNFLPWRLYQNYLYDKYVLEYTSLQDSYMKFYK